MFIIIIIFPEDKLVPWTAIAKAHSQKGSNMSRLVLQFKNIMMQFDSILKMSRLVSVA